MKFAGISKINVKNFKSIQDAELDISPITILAGANSAGKSSIMQPILMMKQTLETVHLDSLGWQGPNVFLSTPEQIIPRFSSGTEKSFSVSIENSYVSATSTFGVCSKKTGSSEILLQQSSYVLPQGEERKPYTFGAIGSKGHARKIMERVYSELLRSPIPESVDFIVSSRRCFNAIVPNIEDSQLVTTSGFHPYRYILNDILGIIHLPGLRGNPETVYSWTPLGALPHFPGTFPRYTASLIEHWERTKVAEYKKLVEYLDTLRLAKGVSVCKLDERFLEILVGWHPHESPVVKNGKNNTDMVNIVNVGLGVSQALPILAALLVAHSNQIVYVEQPCIHLHPWAQMGLVKAVIDAALRGVKVILETHSATFLLALQVALAESKLRISHEQVALYWFCRDENGVTKIDKAELHEDGSYGPWPIDFAPLTMGLQVNLAKARERIRKEKEGGS